MISKTLAALADSGCTAAHFSDDCFRAILSTAGCIPLVDLVQLSNERLVNPRLLNDVVFGKTKAGNRKPNFTRPIGLNASDSAGNPLLTLILGMRSRSSTHSFAYELSSRPDVLKTVDLFAVNTNGICAIELLANTPSNLLPRRAQMQTNETMMLQQRLLAAWQAKLGPLLRSVWSLLLPGGQSMLD